MLDRAAVRREFETYAAATHTLNEWIAGARAFALLRGTLASGLFGAVQVPRTVEEIADLTGLEVARVTEVCAALDAHGIVEVADDRYCLTDAFATLSEARQLQPLVARTDYVAVQLGALEALGAPARPYPTLPAATLLAVAQGVTASSSSPLYQAFFPAWLAEQAPEVRERLEAGGRHVEFGCGIGGMLLGLLLIFPALTAVGIEINAEVIAETRRRAGEFGVADRVELRHADARDVTDYAAFDTGMWSQGFFPRESRAATLAALWQSLKPGGLLLVPSYEGGEPPTREERHTARDRDYTLSRLAFGRWDVPALTIPELRAEVEGAGFVFLRLLPISTWQFLLLRRPAL